MELNRFKQLLESTMGNVKPLLENQTETVDADNFVNQLDLNKFCSIKGVPPIVTRLLNALPEDKRDDAKQLIKNFANAIKNKSVKELIGLRKEIKDKQKSAETQNTQNVNEQLAPIIIAGITISPSLLIAIGAILLITIIFIIITKSSKGGSCNPGWWDDL